MNKKYLPLAVGTALAMGSLAAHADVKLFGRVQTEYSGVKIDSTSLNPNSYTQSDIGDNGVMSRWGLQISEPLGNGLKAIAHIEYYVQPGTGIGPLNRSQWVGLAGPWGAFVAGRTQAPTKLYGGADYDIFNATALQAVGAGGAMWGPPNGFGAATIVDHAIKYTTPKLGGFQLSALVMPSNSAQSAPNTASVMSAVGSGDTGGKGGAPDWDVAAKYDFSLGQMIVGYAVDKASDLERTLVYNGRNLDDQKFWQLGGKLNLGPFTLLGQYQHINHAMGGAACSGGAAENGNNPSNTYWNSPGTAGTAQCNTAMYPGGSGNIWFLGGQYKIGNAVLVLQGGRTKADGFNGLPDMKARNITVGAVYFFSKRTRVFGGYQKVDVDYYSNFASGVLGGTIVHPNRSVWDIGLRQDF